MRLLFLVCITLISSNLTAQYDAVAKQSIAVVDFDVRGYKMNQIQAIQFLTNELNKKIGEERVISLKKE